MKLALIQKIFPKAAYYWINDLDKSKRKIILKGYSYGYQTPYPERYILGFGVGTVPGAKRKLLSDNFITYDLYGNWKRSFIEGVAFWIDGFK